MKKNINEQISERQSNINSVYCSVKNGTIISTDTVYNGHSWDFFADSYKITPEELEIAKKSCSENTNTKSPGKELLNNALSSGCFNEFDLNIEKTPVQKIGRAHV